MIDDYFVALPLAERRDFVYSQLYVPIPRQGLPHNIMEQYQICNQHPIVLKILKIEDGKQR
jgi:hypothetical protein